MKIQHVRRFGVGSLYLDDNNNVVHKTCNRSVDNYNCKELNECYKASVSGHYESREDTRYLCKARHSEVWMVETLKNLDINPSLGTLLVTRYPCRNCSEVIAKFGIKNVIYGGKQEISDEVREIFEKYNINYKHYPDVDYEDYEQYKNINK